MTDCKSLYDALHNLAVAGSGDRQTAFELILARQLLGIIGKKRLADSGTFVDWQDETIVW